MLYTMNKVVCSLQVLSLADRDCFYTKGTELQQDARSNRLGACDPPCLLLCDLVESRREEGRVPERALLILVIWDKAAVTGPTVIEASSSMIVSICSSCPVFCTF